MSLRSSVNFITTTFFNKEKEWASQKVKNSKEYLSLIFLGKLRTIEPQRNVAGFYKKNITKNNFVITSEVEFPALTLPPFPSPSPFNFRSKHKKKYKRKIKSGVGYIETMGLSISLATKLLKGISVSQERFFRRLESMRNWNLEFQNWGKS